MEKEQEQNQEDKQNLKSDKSSQVIVICAACFSLGGIWVLISVFDDDNDGDGITLHKLALCS